MKRFILLAKIALGRFFLNQILQDIENIFKMKEFLPMEAYRESAQHTVKIPNEIKNNVKNLKQKRQAMEI